MTNLAADTWVPVSERLPQLEDGYSAASRDPEVQCCFADGIIETFAVEDIACWDSRHAEKGNAITHWRPLPAPPERIGDADKTMEESCHD